MAPIVDSQPFSRYSREAYPHRFHPSQRRMAGAALAEHLGRKVAPSVVYRLLARHGWRRVAPDTRPPKHDPVAQAAWKTNSRTRWQPC
jgi:hypothetical protein